MQVKARALHGGHTGGMKMHSFCLLAAVSLTASCSRSGPSPVSRTGDSDALIVYKVTGIVRGTPDATHSVAIEHEDIPGFMPSMTMPFEFKNPTDTTRLHPGDAVQFDFVVTDKTSWAEHVKNVPAAQVHLPHPANSAAKTASADRLREGDPLPPFRLIDQNGTDVTNHSFAGKTVVLTFIFTTCPVPNFCPRMSQQFSELQEAVESDPTLRGSVQLLSISFDPEHDKPATLAAYGAAFKQHPGTWRFATGTQAEIDRLTSEFSVYIKAENGTLSHGLCTAIVSPQGVVQKILRGNGWEPGEVLTTLHRSTASR